MEYFLIEMLTIYAPQIMEAIWYIIVGVLTLAAGKYLKPLLQNKVVMVLAKNAVKFVEQSFKDLHGEEKLDKALEALSLQLAKWKIKISADEMKVMLEAALADLNGVFTGVTKAQNLIE